jgi:hypothetical protein
MSDTLDILRQIALQVRNASAPAENTAERVGRVLVGILERLSESDIDELKAMFLRKDQPDEAAELITFIEGLISQGLIEAKGGIKLPSGAALYSLYENGLLAFSMDENGFVIYEKGTANKWSVITSAGAEFQNLVIKFLAQITDLEVLNKATTLDLVVQALAKTHDLTVDNTADIMHGIIREYLTSESFVSGFLGSGFKIWKDANGDWNGEFDKLTVRKIFTIFELVVQKVVHQGGQVIRSAAGGKLVKVTDGGTYWKCEHDSTDDFLTDDQVLCQTFTGTSIKRYWRKVTSAGAGYFNLSKTDCEDGSANPEVGDYVAVLGNRTNTDRQSAQIDCAVGVNAPYRDDYAGINSYSLAGKLINRTGNLSGITDPDFGVLSGSGLIGMNAYLKGVFRLKSSGKLVEDAISDAQSESNAYTDGKITTVETNFEIREGLISSKVTQATTAATQASGYATSAQGSASTATTKATAASNSATAAAGSATTAGQKAADAAGSATAAQDAADDAATILSQVTTKESSINQTASNITLQVSEVTTKVTTATNAANTATTKAGEASTSATNAANSANQASDILTTVVQKETSINQTAQAIELKAVRAESAAGRAESAEASINLKADGIVLQASSQAAQQAVNGVQIGGRNLLLNTGNKIDVSTPRNDYHLATYAFSSPLEIGKTYTISFKVKTFAGKTGQIWFGTNQYLPGSYDKTINFNTENIEQVKTHTGVFTATQNDANIVFYNFGYASSDAQRLNNAFILYDLKLEEGNKATDWTPAPEDVASDAQTKANAAQMAAQQHAENYANNNFTAKTTYNADLTILSNQINSRVSRTDFDALGLRVSSAETSISQQASQIALKASQSDLTAIGDRVSSAEAKITSDAINLTVKSQITTAVDAVQVGGRNYFISSQRYINTWGGITYEADNSSCPYGFYAVGDPDNINTIRIANVIKSNGYWTLSWEMRGLQSSPVFVMAEICNTGGTMFYTTGDNTWKRFSLTVNVTNYGDGSIYNFVDFYNFQWAHFYVRNIKVEKGNKATDWTPAPEDVDASIALRPTTEEIKSQFTMDSSGISMMGKKIALTGLITFSSLDSSTQSTINGKATTSYVDTVKSTAESALANAGTANQSISTLQSNLGQMAYQNMVSLAKLDSTIVEGGYFKTSLIDANAIITGSLLAAKIAATDITTTRLTVSEGCTVGGFAIGNGRIGSIASATGSGGELAIYSNFFRVGGSDGYVMLGNNVIPATAGGAFNATGRIVNQTVNQGAYWGYDACNTGLYISVSGGTKNFGIDSNAALKAPAFINTKVKYLVFGTSYSIDLSQYSVFMCYAASAKSVIMPDETSIAKQFSLSSLPSDFGCIFTFHVIGGSSDITLNNVIDWNMSSINLRLAQGDSVQLLVTKFPNFHYQVINHTN